MDLSAPVTVQPPPQPLKTGTIRTFKPITFSKLDVTLVDNIDQKLCVARIRQCPRHLVLWQGDAYDAIGDYTQTQAENRIRELLGDDPRPVLETLFIRP